MKPFNLERALAGDPVITRNGKEVTVLYLFKQEHVKHPVLGVIDEYAIHWSKEGYRSSSCSPNEWDLFMAPEKKSIWVNVYESADDGNLFLMTLLSKEEALMGKVVGNYIKTIEITNEP